jgi:quercetin dioxygenase-like cupin family protein
MTQHPSSDLRTSPWTAADPLSLSYSFVAKRGSTWVAEPAVGGQLHVGGRGVKRIVHYRDLGLGAASGGLMTARHLRMSEVPTSLGEWHVHDFDFCFVYILQGSIEVQSELGRVVLNSGSTAHQGRFVRHRIGAVSGDCELISITAVWTPEGNRDHETRSTSRAKPPAALPHYTHDTADAWVKGAGPRPFWDCRKLDTAAATEGRIEIEVLRAPSDNPGTGWHYHTMGQFAMVLAGRAELECADRPRRGWNRGDAACLGSGPGSRQNVTHIAVGFTVLQVTVPAVFETIPVDPPDGARRRD